MKENNMNIETSLLLGHLYDLISLRQKARYRVGDFIMLLKDNGWEPPEGLEEALNSNNDLKAMKILDCVD